MISTSVASANRQAHAVSIGPPRVCAMLLTRHSPTACGLHQPARPHLRPATIFPASPRMPHCPSSTVCHAAVEAGVVAAVIGAAPFASIGAVAATGLGYLILVGACFRSVPQITRIIKEKSVEGLSVTAFMTELVCFTITVAYNINQQYPFSQYGDVVACWIQDIIIMGLFAYHLKPEPMKLIAMVVAFLLYAAFLMGGGASPEVLQFLQGSTIVAFALGNSLPQIMLNHKRGNTGVLSLTTSALNVAGCAARVFTTCVLTKDILIGTGFSIQLCLNGILLWQCWKTAQAEGASDAPPKAKPA